MSGKKVIKGYSIRTYPVPPKSFDFDKATDRQRKSFGIPRCPVAFTELEKRWKAKGRNFRIIEPTFKLRERRRKRLPGLKLNHDPETNTIWSGGIVFPPAGDTMKWIEATWTMPSVAPPGGAQSDIWYTASTWIGIDGDDGSGDVLQAGCDADVMISGGSTQTQFNPWWEWYPADSFWITSMTVSAGDELTCLICVSSPTSASIFLGNVTTGVGHFFSATPPSGISLQGNCAEWIVEALETGPANAPELAQYTTVDFTECNAGTAGGKTVQASDGNTIDIVDATNAVISEGEILSTTEVQVSYV